MEMTSKRRGRTLAAVAAVFSLLALTACGGAGGDSGGAGDTDSSSDSKYQARLEQLYKGTFAAPKGPSVKAPRDKSIWFISVGQGIDASVRMSNGMEQAAKKLGWKVKVFDSKFDPTRMLTGVQQAIADKADGIVMGYIDCATVKTGVQQAKKAGIPFVGIESQECQPSLLSHVVSYTGKVSFRQFVQDWGATQAAWVIAKTNGKAKTIINTGTDTETTRLAIAGTKREFAKCPTCEIVGDATYVAADLGPKLQEKIQQMLIKHPDANSFIPSFDAVMTQSGGAEAIRATGRMNQLVVAGGEGSQAGIAQIRKGTGMQSCSGQVPEQEAYAAVDALVRVFLNRDPKELDSGVGLQVCDKDHNLPPEGQPFQPPVDYASDFAKLWGVG